MPGGSAKPASLDANPSRARQSSNYLVGGAAMLDRACTFSLDTPLEYFRAWLEKYTQFAFRELFPTEQGRICLQRASVSRQFEGGCVLGQDGAYIIPGDQEGTEELFELRRLIEFKLEQLAPERIAVSASCSQAVLWPYFLSLLAEVKRRWPESREAIGEYLGTAEEIEPAEDQGQEATERAAELENAAVGVGFTGLELSSGAFLRGGPVFSVYGLGYNGNTRVKGKARVTPQRLRVAKAGNRINSQTLALDLKMALPLPNGPSSLRMARSCFQG